MTKNTPEENLQAMGDEARYQQRKRTIQAMIWALIIVSIYWFFARS